MIKLDKMYERLDKMAEEAAKEWKERQFKNEWASLYLYHSLAVPDGEWGMLAVSEECPDGYFLSSPERLSPAFTKDKIAYKIRGIMNALPIVGKID